MSNLNNDIARYLRGELTPEEMHALEKKALQDPFLADALEGVSLIPQQQLDSDLNDLNKVLLKRITKRNRTLSINGWVGRVAAGLIILVVAGFIVFNLQQDESTKESLAEYQLLPKDASAPATDSVILKDDKNLIAKAEPKPQLETTNRSSNEGAREEQKRLPSASTDEKLNTESVEMLSSEIEETEMQKDDDVSEPAKELLANDELTKAKKSTLEVPSVSATRTSETSNALTKIIEGHVTFVEDGQPLPGVNVIIKGTNTGTVTDEEGRYKIEVDAVDPTLVFSFIGFENTEIDAGEKNNIDVQLQADVSQLSEVVVTGYGDERADESYATVEFAAPGGGRKAFKQYLVKSVQYPEQALKNNVEGKVTVQFVIESTGQLSNFKIIKGIGYGCDEEVIRLIKQGPQWTPTKRASEPIRDKVKVRLKFVLPKK